MRLLDRYVLRQFLRAYLYCIAAFISIWLVFDISDNVSVFLGDTVSALLVVQYYLTQIPQILVILLPVSLLLALLFSLSRMSRTNEIVSMLTAGVSIPRLLLPLMLMGLLTAAASGVLNYALAPHAEETRKTFFGDTQENAREPGLVGQVFRNRADNRTWFVQRYGPGANEFTTVQVLQQDANDTIVKGYTASSARYRAESHTWEFLGAKIVSYDETGNITDDQFSESLIISDW
ncbi:MAG TPA: LptF/LptG family permease, partial [Chthoniobacterales bacterium]